MAQQTPLSVDAIYIAFLDSFQNGLSSAPTWSDRLVTKFNSASRENRYLWVDKMPRLRKWVGPRVFNSIARRAYALVNDDYEDSFKLDRNVVDDDGYGLYEASVRMLGAASGYWQDDMIADILLNGDQSKPAYLCHDGQPFFSASHPANMDSPALNLQSNLFTAGTSGARALTATNYAATRAAMMSWTGADGKPLGIVPNLLVVPPALEQQGRQLLQADFIAPAAAFGINAATGMQNNTLKGSADLLVIPQLAGNDTTWFMAQVGGPLNPFIFQTRKAPELVVKRAADDEGMFLDRELKVGVDARGAAGYTFWFLASKCVG